MAALAAAVIAPPAARAAGVVVRVGDRATRIDGAALRDAADVPAGTYTLRGKSGAGSAIAHPAAVSLPRVLELAGIAPDAVSFVSLPRPNGTLIALRKPDLARPAPFPEGPPLVWLDADSVRFLRPVRDASDVNAADNLATAGDDLVVRVRRGALLQVELRVAPERPRAGRRAHLEANVSGAASGAGVTVRWRFGDGSEATGAAVSHRWRREGVYSVVASAAGVDDSGGASEPLVVRVGAPREQAGPAGGGEGDPERSPATGESEAERTGPASPAPPSSAPPAQPAPDARHTDGKARDKPRHATPPRKQRLRAGRTDLPGAVAVRGVLVSATLPASAPASPSGAPPPPAAARPGSVRTPRDATLPAGGAAACALLALGAWRERRRRHE